MTINGVIEAELYLNYFCQVLSTENSYGSFKISNYYKFKRDLTDYLDNPSPVAIKTIKNHLEKTNSKFINFTNYNPAIESDLSILPLASFKDKYLFYQFRNLFSLNPTVKLEQQTVPYLLFPLYIGILCNLVYNTNNWETLRYNAFSVALKVQELMSAQKNNIIFPDNIPYKTCYKYLLNYYFSDSAFSCINELEQIKTEGSCELPNRYNKKLLNQYILQLETYTVNEHNKIYNHLYELLKSYKSAKSEIYFFDSNEIINSSIDLHTKIVSQESKAYDDFIKEHQINFDVIEPKDTTNNNLSKIFQEYKKLNYKIDVY